MKNIYDLTLLDLENELKNNNIAKFRAKQVYNWLYKSLVYQFDEMSNLDKKTIAFLEQNYFIPNYVLETKQENSKTQKVLLKLNDKNVVESVLMNYPYGNSVCVTTQVGCKIGCSFCASGLAGFSRNLSTGEIVMQIVHFARILKEADERISHIVIMGIGEPLDNLDNVLKFIDIINSELTFNIGARHITLSTSGIAPKIYDVAEYDKQINLAISLHAPNNELRSQIMKINNTYSIEDVLKAVDYYIEETNRRVSIEYILIKNVNDSAECARELAKLLRRRHVHINLIKYNKVEEFEYQTPENSRVNKFKEMLEDLGLNVTVRKSLGNDIDGACGQLRLKNG